MQTLLLFVGILTAIAYALMWVDKLKSIYRWWRISEKMLWIFAVCGGVFGIWLGMQYPLYHKAAKRSFRIGVPVIAGIWIIIGVYLFSFLGSR